MTLDVFQKTADPTQYVLSVSFTKVGKIYHFDFRDFPHLQSGDHVIVETSMLGQQMGQVKAFKRRKDIMHKGSIYPLLRPATPADLLMQQQWKEREVSVLIECREKAASMGGYESVKFAAADYNYDGTMLIIYFVTDEFAHVNTHRLRVLLQKHLDTHIEFRQVGPRDVAKLQEGFGACGIPRCCSTFLTDFSMVSINMAKAQGISLNPTEITGMCGRLRCCLTYEYEQYVEARRKLPRFQKRVGTPHGEGRVVEIHPLEDAVTVLVDDQFHFVTREELTPLSEYEALKKAAASPCSKSESGGCDCGAKRPRGSADELMAEMGIDADFDIDEDDGEDKEEKQVQSAQPVRHSSRRQHNRRRRSSGRRKGEAKENERGKSVDRDRSKTPKVESDTSDRGEKPDQPHRKRRRRSRRRRSDRKHDGNQQNQDRNQGSDDHNQG
ncbi:MAG TPA: regulatory iron-sulfur-containing complex subunit RicT [Aggregatilineales bacterium]|nr:regulatory iron-sulfur-containing complex subunit RicT [Aggregatilineales bacterium]